MEGKYGCEDGMIYTATAGKASEEGRVQPSSHDVGQYSRVYLIGYT